MAAPKSERYAKSSKAKTKQVDVDLSQDEVEANLKKVFGRSAPKILEMMNGDEELDSALVLITKQMLASHVALLPIVENAVVESNNGKGTYPYVQLIASIRSLVTDLQQMQDSRLIADTINLNIVDPACLQITQATVEHLFRLRTEIIETYAKKASEKADINALFKDTGKAIADAVTKYREQAKERITERLASI